MGLCAPCPIYHTLSHGKFGFLVPNPCVPFFQVAGFGARGRRDLCALARAARGEARRERDPRRRRGGGRTLGGASTRVMPTPPPLPIYAKVTSLTCAPTPARATPLFCQVPHSIGRVRRSGLAPGEGVGRSLKLGARSGRVLLGLPPGGHPSLPPEPRGRHPRPRPLLATGRRRRCNELSLRSGAGLGEWRLLF